jgi:hypothetical protein
MGSDSHNYVSRPNAGRHAKARRGSVPVRAAPNQALHLTASSVRAVRRASGMEDGGPLLDVQASSAPLERSTLDHSMG